MRLLSLKTRSSLRELLELDPGDEIFNRSKYAFHRAQMEVSFQVPGYERIFKSAELHFDIARIAVDRLHREYRELFDS